MGRFVGGAVSLGVTGRRTAVVVAAVLLAAAAPAKAGHSVVRHYATQDGLPQLQVVAIAQDRVGYLWVGTQTGGVGRYNGHRWTVYDATNGLPGSILYTLATGADGSVYAGTGSGAARFDGERWIPVGISPGDPSLAVLAISVAADGRVWLGTPRGLRTVPPGAAGRAVPVEVGAPELVEASIGCLAQDPDGSIWVGTSKGLARIRPGASPRLEFVPGLPAKSASAVLARPGGTLLVGFGEAGLWEGRPGEFTRVGDVGVLGRQVSALQSEAGNSKAVWIGTLDRGAFRWDGTFERFGPGQGLKDLSVNAVFRDREGLLWFGGDSGLWKRAPAAFVTWDSAEGIPEGAAVYAMAEDPAHSLWLALSESGLLRIGRDGDPTLFPSRSFENSRPNDVAVDRDGSLLVAAGAGLFRVSAERVTKVGLPAGAPTSFRAVRRLRSGDLALGTETRGLFLVHDGRVVRAGPPVGLKVNALFEAADGMLWTGGEGWGVAALKDGEVVRTIGVQDGLPSNQVNGVFVDSAGFLWVATDRGVFRQSPTGSSSVIDRAQGLPDSFVYWVGESPDRAIWVGTNRGVARILPGGGIEVYTSRQGLGSDECNEGGFLVDSRGRVLIGTTGASLFLGPRTGEKGPGPAVVLEETLVGGKVFPRFGQLPVPPGSGRITFRFAGLSFTDENAVRFRYRLLGLSEEWTDSQAGQYEITYAAVPPGRLRFEVEAVLDDGRRSPALAKVTFTVRPRWWHTDEFVVGVLVALVLAVVVIIRVRERRILAARAQLERQVADRTEELRRANERLAELAVRDELTGLANRRRILERLSEGIALARRQKNPFSVALADLDFFKEVNDLLGHAAGDRVLCETANAMKESLRDVDDLGRYGGDEFLVLLPGSDAPGASAAAERLREAVTTRGPGSPTERSGGLSIGLATLDDTVRDGSDLIHRADLALYEAKRLGRNRVAAWRAG